MALDFPSSPTDGQEYTSSGTTFVYDATNSRWVRKLNQSSITAQALTSIGSHIIPSANDTYDLGSSSLKFNDLYLSANSLNIGGAEITASGNSLNLPTGTLLGSTEIPSSGSGGGTQVVATVGDLPGSPSTGDQAFVSGNSRLYFYNGSGWYSIALANEAPTFTTSPDANYVFTTGGSSTDITVVATDPEGLNITYTGTISDTSIATVSQADNVFTVTPTSTAGTTTLTITATDSYNTAIQTTTSIINGVDGFSSSAPAAHPDDIVSVIGSGTSDGWYYIQPSSGDTTVYCYCIFDTANSKGYILMASTDHSEANTMITHNPSTEDGFVLRSDDSTSVTAESTFFSSNSYLRVSASWLSNLEAAGDGTTMDIRIKAIDDTSGGDASSWDDMTHDYTITGLPNVHTAFGLASLNGSSSLGSDGTKTYYLHDRTSQAYGSYHQGIADTTDYHANTNNTNHWGHWHRSGVNTGVYSFGAVGQYIQETEWDARFFYFIR